MRAWLGKFIRAIGMVLLGLATIIMAFLIALGAFIPVLLLIGLLGLDPPLWVYIPILGLLTLAVMVWVVWVVRE